MPGGGKVALVIFLFMGIFIAVPLISFLVVFTSSGDFSWEAISPMLPMLIFFIVIFISIMVRVQRATARSRGDDEENIPSIGTASQNESNGVGIPVNGHQASVMGRCPRCGNLVFIGDRHCFNCGWKVRERRLRPIED